MLGFGFKGSAIIKMGFWGVGVRLEALGFRVGIRLWGYTILL